MDDVIDHRLYSNRRTLYTATNGDTVKRALAMQRSGCEDYWCATELELTLEQTKALNLALTLPPAKIKESLERQFREILAASPLCYVGPNTLYPAQDGDVEFRESPVIMAAKRGKTEALQFYVGRYGPLADLNRQGACTLARTYSEDRVEEVLHDVSPLGAACLGESPSLDLVKYLVTRGADVNRPNCRGSTPLMGVAYSGHLDIVKYLTKQGANVNAENLTGNTPLCAAAMGGHLKVVKFLHKKGANLNHQTVVGHTPFHIAVSEGHLTIVKEFLSHSVADGNNTPYDSTKPGFIPPPVLLAASESSREVVEFLLRRPCHPEVKIDALLLLGASIFEQRKLTRWADLEELWGEALSLREKYAGATAYLAPIEAYGNVVEMRTLEEFHGLLTRQHRGTNMYHQALHMRERIMSYGDLGLIRRLSHSTMELILLGRLADAEQQWIRLMDMMVHFVGNKPADFTAHFFAHSFHPMWKEFLESFFEVFEKVIIPTRHLIDYRPFLNFVLKGIDFLRMPMPSAACRRPCADHLIDHALYLLLLWHVQVSTGEQVAAEHSDLDRIGSQFVRDHLLLRDRRCSLLHVCLGSNLVPQSHHCSQLPGFVSMLLRWGADETIDWPDRHGATPLHYAVKLPSSCQPQAVVRALLEEGGAHVDIVNRDGATPMTLSGELNGSFELPLSLSCLACHAVVRDDIPYMEVDIPRHLKRLVRFHDKSRSDSPIFNTADGVG